MGQTRRQLRVDYNSTLLGVFIDVLCYMHTFEALPACNVIGVGVLLRGRACDSSKARVTEAAGAAR